MYRPDWAPVTVSRPTMNDVAALNRLFSDAFTERYRRDGMPGIRVPYLNRRIWQYAIADAGEGAMIWRDGRGELIAFNMVHHSGREGWMGPLAVRVDRQGGGLGQRIVQAGVDWLVAQGATTIGVETMPRTTDNIGFYSRLGFRPGGLTISLQARARGGDLRGTTRLSALPTLQRSEALTACRQLSEGVVAGVDFTRELEITLEWGLGDAHLCYQGTALVGMVLWHGEPLAEGRTSDELRILKLVARDLATARRLVLAVTAQAVSERVEAVSIRCQANEPELYDMLIRAGWQVHWTDLRMTLSGRPEPPHQGILISNWEI